MNEITASRLADQPFTILQQFVKDLSFTIPDGANVFSDMEDAPEVRASVAAESQPADRGRWIHEVVLRVEADGSAAGRSGLGGESLVFSLRLAYAAVIELRDVQDHHVPYMVLVEAPRLLFPFARKIVFDTTRDGGFAPVRLHPIDFNRQFRERSGLPQVEPPASDMKP